MGNTCCKLPRRSRTARAQRYSVLYDTDSAAESVNENQSTTEVLAKLPTKGTTESKMIQRLFIYVHVIWLTCLCRSLEMVTSKMIVFVVKRYAVREGKTWQCTVRNAKIGRYAVRKGGC